MVTKRPEIKLWMCRRLMIRSAHRGRPTTLDATGTHGPATRPWSSVTTSDCCNHNEAVPASSYYPRSRADERRPDANGLGIERDVGSSPQRTPRQWNSGVTQLRNPCVRQCHISANSVLVSAQTRIACEKRASFGSRGVFCYSHTPRGGSTPLIRTYVFSGAVGIISGRPFSLGRGAGPVIPG